MSALQPCSPVPLAVKRLYEHIDDQLSVERVIGVEIEAEAPCGRIMPFSAKKRVSCFIRADLEGVELTSRWQFWICP